MVLRIGKFSYFFIRSFLGMMQVMLSGKRGTGNNLNSIDLPPQGIYRNMWENMRVEKACNMKLKLFLQKTQHWELFHNLMMTIADLYILFWILSRSSPGHILTC